MIDEVHAVEAVYSKPTFNKKVRINTAQPMYYVCTLCKFKGNITEAIEHVVSNQFTYVLPQESEI